jgi:hypothetical protein
LTLRAEESREGTRGFEKFMTKRLLWSRACLSYPRFRLGCVPGCNGPARRFDQGPDRRRDD